MRRVVVLAAAGAGVSLLAGAAVLLTGDDAPQAARAVPSAPAPEDPLTPDEVRRAGTIASGPSSAQLKAGRVELLYVERDDDKSGDGRRARAYFYDYGDDTVIVRTVDLGRERIARETRGGGTQPPPSPREEIRAAELLLADKKLGKEVRRAYSKAAGRELRSAADLGLRGLVYTQPGGPCATHRCVRLFVRLPDGKFLDTSRLAIDLSAKKVHTLEW
ncbi:hypothetical protein OIE66_03870 [Nonomuraea sp. NBC_01738]|uniref:hypothetical protein n=1 Tax=Nonomuraea sp. NBC_01738 TaxID=2976003 RepID=UPI002E0D0FA7|nr:hypothetical protein OIE66_03870 [Nonomuraea sp. NBC_01738]